MICLKVKLNYCSNSISIGIGLTEGVQISTLLIVIDPNVEFLRKELYGLLHYTAIFREWKVFSSEWMARQLEVTRDW